MTEIKNFKDKIYVFINLFLKKNNIPLIVTPVKLIKDSYPAEYQVELKYAGQEFLGIKFFTGLKGVALRDLNTQRKIKNKYQELILNNLLKFINQEL